MFWNRSTISRILTLLWILFLPACNPSGTSSTPAIPVERVIEAGGVVRISLPIQVHHSHFQLSYYDEHGERQWKTYYYSSPFPLTPPTLSYNSPERC